MKSGRPESRVWKHLTYLPNRRCECNYCHTSFSASPRRLCNHITSQCGQAPETARNECQEILESEFGCNGESISLDNGDKKKRMSIESDSDVIDLDNSVSEVIVPRKVYKVHVAKDYMKFNAAHFIAYKGFRERLHGHNYRVSVTITGEVGPDGYVVDFGDIKQMAKKICSELNETFLVPMKSDVLEIIQKDGQIGIKTELGQLFSFPEADCSILPIVHTSAEELSTLISDRLLQAFSFNALKKRGVTKLEVGVAEATNQMASYEREIL